MAESLLALHLSDTEEIIAKTALQVMTRDSSVQSKPGKYQRTKIHDYVFNPTCNLKKANFCMFPTQTYLWSNFVSVVSSLYA